jgi:hypothetical protein
VAPTSDLAEPVKGDEAQAEQEAPAREAAAEAAAVQHVEQAAAAPAPPPPPAEAAPPQVAVDSSIPAALTPPLDGPPGLVQQTLLDGVRAGGQADWATTYKAMLAQAAVDVQAFAAEAQRREAAFAAEEAQLKRTAAAQVEAAEAAAAAARQRAVDMQAASRAGRQAHVEALEAQRRKADAEQAAALQAQAAEAAHAAAGRILREREQAAASAAVVEDTIRALEASFAQESQIRGRHADTRRLAAAALAMERQLRAGQPFAEALAHVRACASEDELLKAAVASVAPLAGTGVRTREQLQLQLDVVSDACRRTALMPAAARLTLPVYLLSHIASYLRLREPSSEKGTPGDTGGGVEGALARARAAVAQGSLHKAATELERAAAGSAGDAVAAAWVADARATTQAEHALALIRAQCGLLAAALLEADVRT